MEDGRFRAAVVALGVVLGAELAVVGGFLIPLRLFNTISIGVLVAIVGNVTLCAAGRVLVGRSLGGLAPAAGWLAVTVVFAGRGPGADFPVVAGTLAGLFFLFGGATSAVVGLMAADLGLRLRALPRSGSSTEPSGR